jgi:hypothetical protein
MNGAVIGDPHGDLSPRGDGDGKKLSPRVLTGTGTGNFSPRGDGDGGSIPHGDFPVAIPSHIWKMAEILGNRRTAVVSGVCGCFLTSICCPRRRGRWARAPLASHLAPHSGGSRH